MQGLYNLQMCEILEVDYKRNRLQMFLEYLYKRLPFHLSVFLCLFKGFFLIQIGKFFRLYLSIKLINFRRIV